MSFITETLNRDPTAQSSQRQNNGGRSLTVLGCGTMGVAVLSGILDSLAGGSQNPNGGPLIPTPSQSRASTPTSLPSNFITCVKRQESLKRLSRQFAPYMPQNNPSLPVTVIAGDNVKGTQMGDIIILGCKPQMCEDILTAPGMPEALENKLVISILAGTKLAQLEKWLPKSARIVRAMPNTAAKIRDSMTVLTCDESKVPEEERDLVYWMFSQIGRAVYLAEKYMDASTALCGSGPAFYALILEAMSDGGVMMGLPRTEAQMMAAQTMKGAAGMVLQGQHPALVREQVTTPAGCTIGGLMILEDGKVRSTIARSIQEATNVAQGLGSTR